MGRMKDLYIDFLNAQEYPEDSPLTREEWEQAKNRREECHNPRKEEDNGN